MAKKKAPRKAPKRVEIQGTLIHHLHMTLNGDLWAKVQAMAEEEDRTTSSVIRRAILRYMEEEKKR